MPKGRTALPPAIRIAKGQKGAVAPSEQLQQLSGTPELPDEIRQLDPDAQTCWARTTFYLERMGTMSLVSHDRLTEYCCAWASWMRIQREKLKLGKNFWQPKTWEDKWRNEEWRKEQAAMSRVMSDFQDNYGLTPLAATKILRRAGKVAPDDPAKGLQSFLDEDTNDDTNENS